MLVRDGVFIRPVRIDDDFEAMNELLKATVNKGHNDTTLQPYNEPPEKLRSNLFPEQNSEEKLLGQETVSFLAEHDGRIVAFMCFMIMDETHNGYNMIYGINDNYDDCIGELLDRCSAEIKARGGECCHKIIMMNAGEVRNWRLAFWEKYGFVSERYFYTFLRLDLLEWMPLNDVDVTGINVSDRISLTDIRRILAEDNVEFQAPIDKDATPTPDHVMLTLNSESGEIIGIGYYKVREYHKTRNGRVYDGLAASSLGIHFRPEAKLSRKDKRKFIQCLLLSMKELGVVIANGKFSSQDFETFTELLAQGFECFDHISVRLSRPV